MWNSCGEVASKMKQPQLEVPTLMRLTKNSLGYYYFDAVPQHQNNNSDPLRTRPHAAETSAAHSRRCGVPYFVGGLSGFLHTRAAFVLIGGEIVGTSTVLIHLRNG